MKEAAYADRGTRCEGLFRRKVASAETLSVIGFHLHEPVFARRGINLIRVGKLGDTTSAEITAVSRRKGDYYQMDSAVVDKSGRYEWPVDVIRHPQVRIGASRIAIRACVAECDGHPASVPRLRAVSVVPKGQTMRPATPVLHIKPAPGTRELYIGTRLPGAELNRVEAGFGPYHNDFPIAWSLAFPALEGAALGSFNVELQIEAILRDGRTTEFNAILELGSSSARVDIH